jgi:hypothetical protein
MNKFYSFLLVLFGFAAQAQNSIVTYGGNTATENFRCVTQLSNGTFLIGGYTSSLAWVPAGTPVTMLSNMGINNSLGTNKYAMIIQLSADMQQVLHVLHLPLNVAEDIRFIKFNSLPYSPTGDLYISGQTNDTRANGGGYFLAKLNNNFVNGAPTGFAWVKNIWAEGEVATNHPWDVGSDGKVVYVTGQSHAADWCQVARLNTNGTEGMVSNWRTHWTNMGAEVKGLPNTYTGADPLLRSGIVLKKNGRCDMRSWTAAEFNQWQPDGNGGMKKGKWPMDFLYNSPCNIASVSTSGPGYNGYKTGSSQTYAGLNIVVDKRDNSFFLGMNTKSIINSSGLPDFEPALIKMDSSGALLWWSRLYHEVTPTGDTGVSTPDQFIDGLAIDYAGNHIVVNARCHGNNTTNFWNGFNIPANPGVVGFQKQWTGSAGNVHVSWLGKLALMDGTFKASTFVAEYANVTTGLGSAHPDPNMDNWPNPNGGWPNINTTKLARNAVSVNTDGSIIVAGVGRRVMTTANAQQKSIKQLPTSSANSSAWSQFVRVYSPNLDSLKYSSVVVGNYDTLTGIGGDNTDIFGVYKAAQGVVAVGRKRLFTSNNTDIVTQNVTPWGHATATDSSAILVYLKAANIVNNNDFQYTFGNGPLPLGTDLIGYKKEGIHQLEWRTLSAKNVERYVVEKSTDASNFEEITSVPVTNTATAYFTAKDVNPSPRENYYRIKIIETNGSISYTNVVSIYNAQNEELTISPNPTNNIVNISVKNANNGFSVSIINAIGQQVAMQNCKTSICSIDLSKLAIGIYTAQIKTGNQLLSAKIVKK